MGVLVEVVADVGAATLHEVLGEPGPARGGGQVDGGQGGVEQADQVAEALLLAGVRGGGDQDQVPAAGRAARSVQQLVALVAGPPPGGLVGDRGVGLVDDDQLGAVVEELVAAAVGLDEVGGDDDVRVAVEQGLVHQQAAFEAAARWR